MENQEQKSRSQLIIAMKGHPGTGKSTLARAIASSLHCPLLDKDDIRDATFPLEHHLSSAAISTSSLLNELSYDTLFNIAATQLGLGLSVVIDSPLSRLSRLDGLINLACLYGARVIVVECMPEDEGEWRRRLERRGTGERDGGSWHKPNNWEDMKKLLDGYDGCWDYDVGDVPKVVVDTTAPTFGVAELLSIVMEFIESHGGR